MPACLHRRLLCAFARHPIADFRIIGLEGRVFSEGEAVWRLVDGRNDAPDVIIERMSNRKPVTLWVRESQRGETRETQKMPWVYLSR
jgi:hypothetical protein